LNRFHGEVHVLSCSEREVCTYVAVVEDGVCCCLKQHVYVKLVFQSRRTTDLSSLTKTQRLQEESATVEATAYQLHRLMLRG